MNSLVIQNNDMQILQMIATTAHKSGLYNGVGGMEKILMVLLAAHDLGLKPTIALNGGIWNIQGKIEISARLMTSMIRRAGHSLKVTESTDKVCTIYGKRADNGDHEELSFTIEDAVKAGLAGRDVWKKYPVDMLYARAMSRLARRLFPDVIGTAYVEGEIRDGDIQQAEVEVSNIEQKEKPMDEGEVKQIEPKKNKKELPKIEPIDLTSEQKHEIDELYELCDKNYMDKLIAHLKTLGIDDLQNLKQDKFKMVVNGMRQNAELTQKGK